MREYFSDREFGPKPRIEEEINKAVWNGIMSLIQNRITDGSLAFGFPSTCPDGNAIVGTDDRTLWPRLCAEIHDLVAERLEQWSPSSDYLPPTMAILDLIEFIARYIAEPTQAGWHAYSKHHHLNLDRDVGLKKFVDDINRIFSRNGLAYELDETGAVERTMPAPMADLVNRANFSTGDNDLDDLLNAAVDRFLSPKPEARQDALEKLWDAFERLKTIEEGKNKKVRATALIDHATSIDAPVFRSVVEAEFKAMSSAGNEMRIRHSEVGRESVGDNGEKDYLFMRLFSLVWLMLKKTGRLSGIQREDTESDEEIPF